MFSRTSVFVLQNGPALQQQVRGMATLKQIQLRLKAVTNIQKITQSMKMVSAAKYARAERDLKPARPYGAGAKAFYEKVEVAPVETEGAKKLVIAITSDRGLCGAVHTNVSKLIKAEADDDTIIVCVGDKSRAQLHRNFGKQILLQGSEMGRKPPLFGDASRLASAILNSGVEFSSGKIVFNTFRTVVSYRTTEIPIFSVSAVNAAPKLAVYDSLDSEVVQSFLEYSMVSLLYYAMKEGATSEQSARMSAMDNATKNAGEMIDKLTLTFNRTRQAVITRELIEIISGAAAL